MGDGGGGGDDRLVHGDDAGLLTGLNAVLNHLALLKRLGLPRHCVHVDFRASGGGDGGGDDQRDASFGKLGRK